MNVITSYDTCGLKLGDVALFYHALSGTLNGVGILCMQTDGSKYMVKTWE